MGNLEDILRWMDCKVFGHAESRDVWSAVRRIVERTALPPEENVAMWEDLEGIAMDLADLDAQA